MPTKNTTLMVDGYSINCTNIDKILFPEKKITKGDLISYYYSIAPLLLTYGGDRLITMHRYPEGINHEGFYQKNASDYFPAWINTVPLKAEGGKIVHYVVLDKKATLVYLANQACITPHCWLSRVDDLYYPDRMIFDLDPSGKNFDFSKIVLAATIIKNLLEKINLVPFLMTTGSRGLHVVVPLKRTEEFDSVRAFARSFAGYVVKNDPKNFTLELNKKKRGTKIFIDYLRNSYSATAVAPYAVREHPGAPVATPLDWEEIDDKKLRSNRYTYKTVFDRLNKKGNPWQSFYASARTLKGAMKKFKDF